MLDGILKISMRRLAHCLLATFCLVALANPLRAEKCYEIETTCKLSTSCFSAPTTVSKVGNLLCDNIEQGRTKDVENERKCGTTILGVPCGRYMATNNHCVGGDGCDGDSDTGTDPFDDATCPECASPLVLDLDRDGFAFTGPDDPVLFDIDGDGKVESLTWTSKSSMEGSLVLDRNGNGTIETGGELFGNHTLQPETDDPNGFVALAVFDRFDEGGNGDGWISAEDAVYAQLQVWVDENHDGVSQARELTSLEASGIAAVRLEYHLSKRRDRHGNLLRWISFVDFTDNERRLGAVDHRRRPA